MIIVNKLTDDLHASLKKLEWAGNDMDGRGAYCITCGGRRSEGHKDTLAGPCHVEVALTQYALVCTAIKLTTPELASKAVA